MFGTYSISPIALGLLLVYAASFALYRTKRIRVTTHRKIWNVLLLGSFLVVASFGLTMAIRRDYVLLFSVPFNLIFWHVEAGVVMTVVSVFHLSWHLTYYRDLFKRAREKERALRDAECVQEAERVERAGRR
ncbi:MAG: hypothetical protein JW990_11495 [Thermoleophilia bacterium]|nr:hypothetical protein [Thermoleophilia bacterium]